MFDTSLPTFSEVLTRPNLCLAYFLMSSYLYYQHDNSVLTDGQFDHLCTVLLERWGEVTHPHKHLVTEEDLKAGSGYGIRDYPQIVKHAALQWLYEMKPTRKR